MKSSHNIFCSDVLITYFKYKCYVHLYMYTIGPYHPPPPKKIYIRHIFRESNFYNLDPFPRMVKFAIEEESNHGQDCKFIFACCWIPIAPEIAKFAKINPREIYAVYSIWQRVLCIQCNWHFWKMFKGALNFFMVCLHWNVLNRSGIPISGVVLCVFLSLYLKKKKVSKLLHPQNGVSYFMS